MEDRLASLLSEIFQIPAVRITDELAMEELQAWDSLKHMELIASIEQTYDLELTFDEIVAMQSVGEIKRILKARGVSN